MSKRYFELAEDMSSPERWLVSDPVDEQGTVLKSRPFKAGEPIRLDGHLRVSVYHPGTALDFSRADIGGIPVVTEKIARVLTEVASSDIQLFPVQVDSREEPYFLVNVVRLIKCIDDEACAEVRYWEPRDGRPDKMGHYRAVYGMRIDPSKVGETKVFRPWGYDGTLLVAEEVKDSLERTGATGLRFKEVTGPSPISAQERAYKKRCRELLEPPPAAREEAWNSLGSLDTMACAPSGICYEWPAYRQGWKVIHRPAGRTLLVTDGLSDPFIAYMEPSVGFGLELVLETDEQLESIEKSWSFQLLERVGEELIAHEPIREGVRIGLMSLEVPGKGLPPSLLTAQGKVGVLLGVESPTLPRHFPTPFGDVRLVTVKALFPTEWAYLLEHGGQGRTELARRFMQGGEAPLSSLQRRAAL